MSRSASPLAREATLTSGAAAALAAALAYGGPPGADLAAHIYQRAVFVHQGFTLWNNFWYAGRYSFISYSVIYYPLAAALGIRLLAVATIATAALAFAVVVWREWGPASRWSSRTFAVVWAGIVLSAAFPFALGIALALLALWALQARRRWQFACLAALTTLASPVAFVTLLLIVVGVAISRHGDRRTQAWAGAALFVICGAEVVIWRAFPDGGHYPFSFAELAAALVFCGFGAALTWRVDRARLLRWVFPVYAVACTTSYLVPSGLGENVARIRFAAIPVTVLILTLRRWRPRFVALVALGLATAWNVTPLAAIAVQNSSDPTAQASYWQPAISFLHSHLTPSYRVEAVDTANHWDALYLPRAGIPLARGWFRQDDFPENAVLYRKKLSPGSYLAWLRRMGVRYVVLTDAAPDYSAEDEAELVRGPTSPLRLAFRGGQLAVYAVPHPVPIVTGPGRARVLKLTASRIIVRVGRPGAYAVGVRYSPYWEPSAGCLTKRHGGLLRLTVKRPAVVTLRFEVDAAAALNALTGSSARICAG
jgi:hypothetical protein